MCARAAGGARAGGALSRSDPRSAELWLRRAPPVRDNLLVNHLLEGSKLEKLPVRYTPPWSVQTTTPRWPTE